MRSLFYVVLLIVIGGCSLLDDLRGVFHADPTPPGEPGDSELSLIIDPSENIRVVLDGVLVTRNSPYEGKGLSSGEHQLRVLAEGYHPFATPVVLKDDSPVELRIALRRKPPPPLPVRERRAIPQPPPKPPTPPGPALPDGVEPINLKLATQPDSPVLLDGRSVVGKSMMLKRVSGRIESGPIRVVYRIGGSGLLEITVPDDNGTWFRDGRPLEEKTFPLHHGSVRLERKAEDESLQIIWLRR